MRRISSSPRKPLVSVITATIPGRESYLAECLLSVEAQTAKSYEHLILTDHDREGCSVMVNRMVEQAAGEWLLPIADDDLLLPRCIETLLSRSEEADIVYSPPLVWGVANPWWYFEAPPLIPSTALVRTAVWRSLGGYDSSAVKEEDRKLWTKAVEAGARFVRADSEPTWVYRVHAGSKSFHGVST